MPGARGPGRGAYMKYVSTTARSVTTQMNVFEWPAEGGRMKIAVLGAGSIGMIIGALLAKKGAAVTLIDSNRDHVAALNSQGARITGHLNETIPVRAITPDKLSEKYDLVILAVKQNHNEAALSAILPYLQADGIVATVQNGVPETAVIGYIGEDRVVGCPVGWGATWIGPGVSELTSETGIMTISLGAPGQVDPARLDAIERELSLVCQVERIENLTGVRWTKLIVNATMSGISTVIGGTYGDILDNEKALNCVAHIGNEGIRAAVAAGINLEPMQGYDIRILAFETAEEMAVRREIYKMVFGPHRNLRASMLQDLQRGLRTEIDSINGVISEAGKRVGVPTPVNDAVLAVVHDAENGKVRPGISLLDRFQLPELV